MEPKSYSLRYVIPTPKSGLPDDQIDAICDERQEADGGVCPWIGTLDYPEHIARKNGVKIGERNEPTIQR